MTEGEIAELFIRAAETDAKLPQVKGMRESYGRYVLPWTHDLADINGRRRVAGDKLLDRDDPMEEWRWAWFTDWGKQATTAQIGQWESCVRIAIEFVKDDGQRRALWAWAMAQASNLWLTRSGKQASRISFAKWCREVEHVAEMTGHRRKNRALTSIQVAYHGKAHLHLREAENEVLPDTPQIDHVFATVEGQHAVYDTKRVLVWQADPSFKTTGLTMREWRNARRRQREAAKRKREKVAA